MSGNVHEATLVERREIAASIDELCFTLPAPFRYRAGQFVSIRIGEDADGAAILRSYSIAGGATGGVTGGICTTDRFSLVIKNIAGGTATTFLGRLPIGAAVRLTGPMGFFVLDLSHGGDVVFGATGVGIAPVRPMLDELLARPERGKVHLLWGSRRADEVFGRDELSALARDSRLSVRLFLSGDGEARPPFEAGRISAPLLALAPTLDRPTFYLVGSGAMIREVKTGLVAAGVDRKRQIRNEAFFD